VSLEPYAVFADDGEYGQEIGEAKELANALANVEELHLASCGASRGVEADEGAEAHAVHAGNIRQVEHDSFGAWDQWANLGVEDVGHLGDHLSVAPHDGHCVFSFYIEGQAGASWFVRHKALSRRSSVKWLGMGSREFLIRQLSRQGKNLRQEVRRRLLALRRKRQRRDAARERSRWRSGFLHSAAHDETVSCCGGNDIFLVGINLSGREILAAKVDGQ
jgi:hypothetical protein